MGNWNMLIMTLAIMFIISVTLTLVVTPFVEENPQPEGVTAVAYNYVTTGVNMTIPLPLFPDFHVSFNIFSMLGDNAQQFIANQILVLSYIPAIILIPLIILGVTALIYSIVELVLP